MKQTLRMLTFLFLLICLAGACKKEMFDSNTAKKLTELSFHNDTVDQDHDWTLITDWNVRVKANVKGVRRIELLSGNPYTATNVDVVASTTVSRDDVVEMNCSLPVICDSLYAAAIDSMGHYYVVAVSERQYDVDFSTLNTVNKNISVDVEPQEVYYCYCSSYPKPSSTWGFNDCVLRISKEIIDSRTLRINVVLQAVGTTTQIGGALRLDGVSYDLVEKVEPVGGSNFRRAEGLSRVYVDDESVLLKGQDGSAVINMFDDAHAAFYNKVNNLGMVYRYRYNVKHSNTNDCYEFSSPYVSYDITFKNEGFANTITFMALDPFILVTYTGNVWEVHKYRYKFKEILFSYFSGNPQAYDNGFSWALEIPYTWFRYPLIDNSMGSYKKGALYGAYQTFDHSFGEWGADRNKARDWYLYPNTSMVY